MMTLLQNKPVREFISHHCRLTPKSVVMLVILVAAGFAGNYFSLPLFFGVDFLFGSIAVLLVVYLYGTGWGTLAAIIAAGYTYVLWHHPIAIGGNLPWTLVVESPVAPHQSYLEDLYIKSLALMLALAVLAFILAAALSRRLVGPLSRLAEVTTGLPGKLLDRQPIYWPAGQVTEIGYLVDNFKSMVITIRQNFKDIQERTNELTKANEEPETEIAVRKRAEEKIKRINAELAALNAELEQRVAERTAQLEAANKELEAFSYSVSHDLRAPLRSIDGFSQALLEDYADELDAQGKDYLQRVQAASQRMAQLIDDMLKLSRVARSEMLHRTVDLSALVKEAAAELQQSQPERQVAFIIAPGVVVNGDARLLRVVLENLLGNAWKFTGMHPRASIEFGVTQREGKPVYFVRDDGAGFDPALRRQTIRSLPAPAQDD